MIANGKAAPPSRTDRTGPIALVVLLVTMLALRLHLMLRLNINWDEFHYLSFIYDYLRDAPLGWRQTFHVHLFPWLTAAQPDEVSQIVLVRVLLCGLGLASSGLIYLIGRRFLSTTGALFAVLCYNALSEVVVHGASFRPDPLATFLFLAASATVLLRPGSVTAAAAAGGLLAVSFMFTLKTLFFIPSLGILLLATVPGSLAWRRRLYRAAALAVTALLCVAVLQLLHRQAIVPLTPDGGQIAGLQRLAGGLLWTGYWFPGRFYLLRSLEHNALIWIALAGGLAQAVLALRSTPAARWRGLLLLALALPLGTLIFYRNSFPYFYPYILAPAVLLCGVGLDRLRRLRSSSERLGPVLTVVLVLGVFATGVTNYLRPLRFSLAGQRQLIEAIHRMFPEPVPYIDRCSMVASFPKVGFFMSTHGMDRYARRGRPALTEAVKRHAPPFLVANTMPLNLLLPEHTAARLGYPLLEADRRTLRQNYIHHWGIIFVAGKYLTIAGGEATELEILIPGTYTLEGEVEIQVDDRPLRPGEVIELTVGSHLVTAETATDLTLRWGDHLLLPDSPPRRAPIFMGL